MLSRNGDSLRDLSPRSFFTDGFTTLIYGAVFSFLFTAAIKDSSGSIIGLLMSIFIFSDWVSRVPLLYRLPPQDFRLRQTFVISFFKVLCEICGLFFLTLSFYSLLCKPFDPILSPYCSFALFLLFNLIWNMLLIRVMLLDASDLSRMLFLGVQLNSVELIPYTRRLQRILVRLDAESQPSKSQNGSLSSRILRMIPSAIRYCIFQSSFRLFFQIMSNHLTWVGVVGFLLLIFPSLRLSFDLYHSWILPSTHFLLLWSIPNFIVQLFVVIILAWLCWIPTRIHRTENKHSISEGESTPPSDCTNSKSEREENFTKDALLATYPIFFILLIFFGFHVSGFISEAIASIVLAFFAVLVIPFSVLLLTEVLGTMPALQQTVRSCSSLLLMGLLLYTYLSLASLELLAFLTLQQFLMTLFLSFVADPEDGLAVEESVPLDLANTSEGAYNNSVNRDND